MKQGTDKISMLIRFIQMPEASNRATPFFTAHENPPEPGPGTRNRLVADLLKQCGYFWEDEEK